MKLTRVLLFMVFSIFLVACTKTYIPSESEKQNTDSKENKQQINNLLDNLTIVSSKNYSTDEIGEITVLLLDNDTVINDSELPIVNVCFITEFGINFLNIPEHDVNSEFKFENGEDSLIILEEPKQIAILLKDIKNEKSYKYELELHLNKSTNSIYIDISSIQL